MSEPSDCDINTLLRASVAAFKSLPPEIRQAREREQAISFVYGNLAIENDLVTREMVADAYDRISPLPPEGSGI